MKKILLAILLVNVVYGVEPSFNKAGENGIYMDADVNYNMTDFLALHYGLGLGTYRKIATNTYVSAGGFVYLGDFSFVNKEFKNNTDVKAQTFLGVGGNLKVFRDFNIGDNNSFFVGVGIKAVLNNGQSVSFKEGDKDVFYMGQAYGIFSFMSEIGFSLDKELDFYIVYNIGGTDKAYQNLDKYYNYNSLAFGVRCYFNSRK